MAEAPDLSGDQIGRYRVLTLLGSGGMGAVYDAIDPQLERHVALKVLLPALASDGNRLQRFVQEAKAASALNHPHLVSIYEIGSGERNGVPVHFIAMEKVDGKNLREILGRESVPLRKAIELVAQVADAVAAAHSVGVIHRDLKPENIMVSSTGYAKVLDFGLAKLRGDADAPTGNDDPTAVRSTETGVVLGTAGYMSPEQAGGKAVDYRTDIFALGCVLYEVATGRRAFRGDSSVDTLHKIIYSEPEALIHFVPAAPPELQRIVIKALAKNPDERYQSAKDLTLDLKALLRVLESPAAPPQIQRSQARRIAASVAVVILLAIAVIAVMRWRRERSGSAAPSIVLQRLTARSNVIDARISPDGRFMAYALREELGQSIWLRQLATGQDIVLVPRTVASSWGFAFTPDGNALVYVFKTAADPLGVLYRISTLGGPSQRISASGFDSAVTFSPDGKRMAWVRADFPGPRQSALIVANSDGTGERVVATRRPPERFVPSFFTCPSWSPDGKWIAASVRRAENPVSAKLIGFDPDSGQEISLSNDPWLALNGVAWLPDQSGLVAVGANDPANIDPITLSATQIWLIPFPSGVRRTITNDLRQYRDPNMTADGTKLVAVALEANVSIWRTSVDGTQEKRLTYGRFDGVAGFSEMPDGHIAFTSVEGGTVTLWVINADGTQRRQLTRDAFNNRYPAAFTRGIAYVSTTPEGTEICVMNNDGEGRRVVVRGVDEASIAISPDEKWIVYVTNRRLWRTSFDGRDRKQLTQEIASSPAYSPGGDRLAFLIGDWQRPEGTRLAVFDADAEKLFWKGPAMRQSGYVRWTKDAKAILLEGWDTNNVWIYPFHGEPRQMTHWGDSVWGYTVSADNRTMLVSRGILSRDAVMITGFR
jgi:serine/threonine protein kinase/outer membrane protein assembly factor BamB